MKINDPSAIQQHVDNIMGHPARAEDPFVTSEELEVRPVFSAAFPGECAGCGGPIDEGDRIRADGSGGYECVDCIEGYLL